MKIISTVIFSASLLSGLSLQADPISYYKVSGMDALKDQSINQFGDEENPPQGYIVHLPAGFRLQAVDVESGGSAVCGVSKYDYKTQTITIDGFSLETDEPGCDVILTVFEKSTKKEMKVHYVIEQVGT